MKRHLQKTGVRKFFGQDLIDLQSEPLKALDGFFAQYGACIITGCEITHAENDTFNVASGLVAIPVVDPEIDTTAIKVMPFDGAEGVVLPLYLTAQNTIVERVYGDGKVKPIAYDFHAAASGVLPETPYITLTANDNNRFVDALQDEDHNFITTSERNKWNAILQLAKDYADNTASVKAEATLRSAKQYTDGKDVVLRNDMAVADITTLRSAKDYADTIVAALVDNSPEALNTLQELAAALGNNPNFATDVLQAIGERATMAQVNEALEGKADKGVAMIYQGVNAEASIDDCKKTGYYFDTRAPISGTMIVVRAHNNANHPTQILIPFNRSGLLTRSFNTDSGKWSEWVEMWHSGNFNPANKADANHVHANALERKTSYGQVDANSVLTTGGFMPTDNKPPVSYSHAFAMHSFGVGAMQFAAQMLAGDRFFMRCTKSEGDAAWLPWVELWHSGNLDLKPKCCGIITSSGDYSETRGVTNVERIASGWRVYHNVTSRYGINLTPLANGGNNFFISYQNKRAGYFEVVMTTAGGAPASHEFSFSLFEY